MGVQWVEQPGFSDDDWAADKRTFLLDERERLLNERESIADEREALADHREATDDLRAASIAFAEPDGAADDRVRQRAHRDVARDDRRSARAEVMEAVEAARTAFTYPDGLPPLVAQFAVLARQLQRSASVEECLDQIVTFADRALTASDSVTVASIHHLLLRTRSATSELGRMIDEMQGSMGEGPCLDAALDQVVLTDNFRTDERWPDLGPLAETVGVLSALSVCICLETETDAGFTLNQYSANLDAFDQIDADSAVALAAHASVALAYLRAAAQRDGLNVALLSRDVIGQAKGILMERGKLTADQAFDALRQASQLLNRKLADIASEVTFTGDIPPVPARLPAGGRER